MISGSVVRLRTTEEYERRLRAIAAIGSYMDGTEVECREVSIVSSSKAPDADYDKPASLVLCDKQVVRPSAGVYTFEGMVETVHVPEYSVCAYFFARMYMAPEHREEALYQALVAHKIRVAIPVPVKPCHSDGQLKILVDFVIAVDHMVTRENKDVYKILVIGSSSESGRSSLAYTVLMFMSIPADITVVMYDPYEETSVTTHSVVDWFGNPRKIVFDRRRAYYEYKFQDAKEYDLLLDDAYIVGETSAYAHRMRIDPKKMYQLFPDYSIKYLPGDMAYFSDDVESMVYEQSLLTKAQEMRITKYPRLYGEVHKNGLGRCSACVELMYMLRRDYNANFTSYVLQNHYKACQPFVASVKPIESRCCVPRRVVTSQSKITLCNIHGTSRPLYIVDRPLAILNRRLMTFSDLDRVSAANRETMKFKMKKIFSDDNSIELTSILQLCDFEVRALNDIYIECDEYPAVAFVTELIPTDQLDTTITQLVRADFNTLFVEQIASLKIVADV